jgi:hypothetical protein
MYVLLNIDQGHGWRKTSMLCCSSARAFMAAAALSSRVGSWQLAVGSVRHGSNNKPAIDAPNKISSPLPASLLFPLQHGHDRGMLVLGLQLHFTYLARYHVTWRSPHEYLHRGIFAFSFPKNPPHTASQQHMAVIKFMEHLAPFPAISPQHYA